MHLVTRLLVGALFLITLSMAVVAQTARIQFLHNAPDPALSVVDVYLDGELTANDFAFRNATTFLEVPAGVPLEIALAPGTSTGAGDALVTFSRTLTGGGTYFLMVTGVADPPAFAPNPNGKNTGVQLVIHEGARTESSVPEVAQFFFAHGAPDAPQAQVWSLGRGPVAGRNLTGFGNATGHGNALALPQTIELRTAAGTAMSMDVDWSGIAGQAGALVASGFLDPASNNNGPELALLQVLADGSVRNLSEPVIENPATFQFIHSSPDPLLERIDVRLERIGDAGASKTDRETDDDVSVDDLPFRSGSTRTTSSGSYNLTVSSGTNKSALSEPVASFEITLEENRDYTLVLTGLASPEGFKPNPAEEETGLRLVSNDEIRSVAADTNTVEVQLVHAVPDAPVLDVIAVVAGDSSTVVDDLVFGEAAPYQTLSLNTEEIMLTLGNDRSVVVGTFSTDFTPYGGAALVVLASGFVTPEENGDGEPLDLFGILPDDSGWTSARNAVLNFVHAIPELKSRRLNIFARIRTDIAGKTERPTDDDPSVDDLPFGGGRTRSAPLGFYSVTVAVDTASGALKTASLDTLASFDVDLTNPDTYELVFAGVSDPVAFVPNPEGAEIGYQILVNDDLESFGPDPESVSISFANTITDAGSLDVLLQDSGAPAPLATGVGFGEFARFEVAARPQTFVLAVSGTADTVRFGVDLTGFGGRSFSLPATGFVDPAANDSSDVEIGVTLIGGEMDTPTAVGNERDGSPVPVAFRLLGNYPNPFNPTTRIRFDAGVAGEVSLTVYDLAGRVVGALPPESIAAGNSRHVAFDASRLPSGVYIYRLTLQTGQSSRHALGRMVVLK